VDRRQPVPGAGSRAFGWFCFFVAVTAVPTGIYALRDAQGNVAATWLAIDWFVWAVLWFLFFLLLALERPIMRQVGWATIAVAIEPRGSSDMRFSKAR
jgi:hypothetical protein